jgi:hypothetical protein
MDEDERCPKCGVPAWWAYSTNPEIEFELDEHTCHSCAFKADEEGKLKDEPGVTRIVRAVHIDGHGEALPDRADFYQRLAKEHELKMSRLENRQA